MLGGLADGALVGTALVWYWQQVCAQRASISMLDRHFVGVAYTSQNASPTTSKGSQWLLTMTGCSTGTADSAGAGVGAADEAKVKPVPSSSTTAECWAASGSQHSAAQIAATSGSLVQRVSVASIAQISGLPILVPQLAPVVCCGVGDGAGTDCKVGIGLGDKVGISPQLLHCGYATATRCHAWRQCWKL